MDDFIQIKEFIKTDIERELQLARISGTFSSHVLDFIGINRGGGNMMTTLALLDYTEFAGHVYAKLTHLKNYDAFEQGFALFNGYDYRKLPVKTAREVQQTIKNSIVFPDDVNVYIGMLEGNFLEKRHTNAGIVVEDGEWYFCIEKYYKDLMEVLCILEPLMRNCPAYLHGT